MVFNSVVFLFCFLPLALLLYYVVPGRLKNAVLLIESLIFFCCSGTRFLPLILILVAVNYLFGLLIDHWDNHSKVRIIWLVIPILVTLGALIFFKYTNFLIDIINQIASGELSQLSFLDVLPVGISYYTFKLISYVADIYSGKILSLIHI